MNFLTKEILGRHYDPAKLKLIFKHPVGEAGPDKFKPYAVDVNGETVTWIPNPRYLDQNKWDKLQRKDANIRNKLKNTWERYCMESPMIGGK